MCHINGVKSENRSSTICSPRYYISINVRYTNSLSRSAINMYNEKEMLLENWQAASCRNDALRYDLDQLHGALFVTLNQKHLASQNVTVQI